MNRLKHLEASAPTPPRRRTEVAEDDHFQMSEVGQLPKDWQLSSIGALFDLQQGKAMSAESREGPTLQPFLRTSNVLWGELNLSSVDKMHFTREEASKYALEPGDLLVCEGGEVGRAAVWENQLVGCLFQNHIHRLRRISTSIEPMFAMYWLQEAFLHRNVYAGAANKTTIPNLSGARLKEFSIPIPLPQEQRAIAEFLSEIQEAADAQYKIEDMLRELKAAVLTKLFHEGLRGEKHKNTEIGKVPRSWDVTPLGKHCRIGSGGTPAREIAAYWNGTIPWVKTGEINYRPITETEEHITEKGLENSSAKIIEKGTVLMAMYGQGVTRGKVAILGINAATNQACAALIPDQTLDPEFLYAYCMFAYERIREFGHGANQKNLSADILKQMLIPVPPRLDEQREIGAIVKKLDIAQALAKKRRALWESLFSASLHALMSGHVRIKSERTTNGRN